MSFQEISIRILHVIGDVSVNEKWLDEPQFLKFIMLILKNPNSKFFIEKLRIEDLSKKVLKSISGRWYEQNIENKIFNFDQGNIRHPLNKFFQETWNGGK